MATEKQSEVEAVTLRNSTSSILPLNITGGRSAQNLRLRTHTRHKPNASEVNKLRTYLYIALESLECLDAADSNISRVILDTEGQLGGGSCVAFNIPPFDKEIPFISPNFRRYQPFPPSTARYPCL